MLFRFVLALACILPLTACALNTRTPAPLARTPLSPEAEQTFYFLMLEQAVRNNDIEAAQTAVRELADLDPREEIFRDGGTLLLFSENTEGARELAERGLVKFPDNAEITMVLAESYLMEQREAEALSVLRQYVEKHPRNYVARTRLGEVYIQLQRFPEAEQTLLRIPYSKRNPYVQFLLAKIQAGLGHQAQAESMLRDLVKKEPNMLEAWSELAFLLESRKDFAGALKIYEMLLPQDNANASLWLRIVGLSLKMNDPTKALSVAQQGPVSSAFRINAALGFMEEGYPAEAETLLAELQKTPGAPEEGWYHLALAMVESRGAYKEALPLLDKVSPSSPFYKRALLLRAQLLAETGDPKQAISIMRGLRLEFPDVPELWRMEAQFLGRADEGDEALSVLNQAVSKWPDDMDLRFSLGVELDRQNKKDEALSIMEYIVSKSPNNPHALNYVGYTLAEQNRELDRALRLIRRALSLYPDSYHIIDSLAWVYYRQKNYPAAWEAIRKALSINERESTLWEHYGDIARAMGKKNEARKGYSKALELGADKPDEITSRLRQMQ